MDRIDPRLELQNLKQQHKLRYEAQDEEAKSPSSTFKIGAIIEEEIKSLNNKNRPVMFAKIAVVFILFLVHFLHTRIFTTPRRSVDCLGDTIFDLTDSFNDRLNHDKHLLKFLQVTSSSVVDFADISVLVAYNLRGVTLAYPFQVFMFYVLRGILQGFFLFKNPKGSVWDDPGIPSLTVPYGIICDYYFSGHCGFVTMMALENYKLGNPKNAIALALLLPYLAFVLLAARVHYSIDIPIGVMFGVYCHYMAHTYVNHVQWLMRKLFNRSFWHKIPFFCEH